jgi:hypothetical protein
MRASPPCYHLLVPLTCTTVYALPAFPSLVPPTVPSPPVTYTVVVHQCRSLSHQCAPRWYNAHTHSHSHSHCHSHSQSHSHMATGTHSTRHVRALIPWDPTPHRYAALEKLAGCKLLEGADLELVHATLNGLGAIAVYDTPPLTPHRTPPFLR